MPIELHALTRRFGSQLALDRVSMRIEEEGCTGLIGHNGAGKTTLLRIVLGLSRADGGRVLVDGFDAARHPREARARMGGLIEVPGFYGALGGRRNLVLLARLQGLGGRAARREADRLLERVDLAHAADKPVQAWSQGMRQRLGIAQALLGDAKYVLLDEPTNGLDPQGIAELRVLLRSLIHDEQRAVLLSSHQLGEVAGLCERIAVLHRGRKLVEEATETLLAGGGGAARYAIETDDDTAAARALAPLGLAPDPADPHLFALGEVAPGRVARTLVEAGRELASFAPRHVTLEEIYLAATQGSGGSGEPAPGAARPEEQAEPRPAAAGAPADRRAPAWPTLRAARHELSRWASRPGVPLLLLLPALAGALAVLRRATEAAADARRVAAGEVFSSTAVTAFEGVGIALGAGLPLLALLLAGLASQSIAGELGRGTLRNLVLRPVRREQLVAGKALAGLGVLLLAYGLTALAALGASAWAFDFGDVVEILPNGQAFPIVAAAELRPELRAALLAPLVPLAAFVGLGFLAGTIARSGVAALGLALSLVLALDLGRGFARAFDCEAWLPAAYVPSPLGDTSFLQYYRDLATGVSNASFAFAETQHLVPAVWCVACLLVAGLLFRRRPIP